MFLLTLVMSSLDCTFNFSVSTFLLCSILFWLDSYFVVRLFLSLRAFSKDSISKTFFSFINLFLSYESNSTFKFSNLVSCPIIDDSVLLTSFSLFFSLVACFFKLSISFVWSTSSRPLLQTGQISEFCSIIMSSLFLEISFSNIPFSNFFSLTNFLWFSNSNVSI